MSDNDLIRRGDTEEARDELVRVLNYINSSGTLDYADYCELFNTIKRVFDALKAVPREMSAREYEKAFQRITYEDVETYRVWWEAIHDEDWGRAVAIVEKWVREHPEERSE